ncbi:MAG: hypothetical protein KDH96_07420 [Candidatus Riesia sp.]|nr:hypothetical protein [Candidatus Riesia sp.]
MSNHNDIPNFGDSYLQYFNPALQKFELRRKSRNEGDVGISEAMELIEQLMKKHQMSFVPSKVDKRMVLFPFAFNRLEAGDQILNTVTKEVYTVNQVILNPETNQWNGLVKLNLINPPSIEQRHSLVCLNSDRYIKFDHEFPDTLLNNIRANPEGMLQNIPPIVPTITWSLKVKEPGGLGSPFDARKELKPRLRESTKDPYVSGYTVEIWGQWFDNIVQFDAWTDSFKGSERLLTWMEQLVKLYTGYLRQKGISQMFFWKRDEEKNNNTWRQQFPVKGSQFYFRTEELEAVYLRDVLKIDISLGVDETVSAYNSQYHYIAGQLVSGDYTPDEYRALFYRSGEYLFGDLDIRQ